jgi:cytochrome oxidase Cu insertion factor (SCO1/SenC/PrrC family)
LLLACACLLPVAGAMALQGGQQEQTPPAHVHHHDAAATTAESEAAPSGPTKVAIPDVVVMDQNNNKVHFYSDLIKGRTVAVNFIFTACTTICPPLTANFAKVQKTLLERGKTEVRLISVSVDPEGDTPEKMKSYAGLFHAQPGWTFVTGTRSDLEQIWRAFSVTSSIKQDHPATVVIGNDAAHTWTYASGLTSASKLVTAVESVLENKSAATAAHNHREREKKGSGPQ